MLFNQIRKILLLISALILLSACKSTPKMQIPAMDEQQKQQYLQNLSNWSFSGKIAIIPVDKSKGKKQSANIRWQQLEQNFSVDVNTFLGINVFSLKSHPSYAVLSFDGEEYQGTSAEQLLNSYAHVSLPITHLPTWIKGIAANTPYVELQMNDKQRLQSLLFYDHFGAPWQLEIDSYQSVDGLELPRKLHIKNSSYKIRLIITEWHIFNE